MLFSVFTEVCLPLFTAICIGWGLERAFNLDLRTLVKLNIVCFVPSFNFVQVVSSDLSAGEAIRVVLFTLTIMVLMFLLGAVAGALRGYSIGERRSLQIGAMFYNSGNYGIPLMTLAFPGVGPVLQVFIIITQNIMNFTLGIFLLSHRPGESMWKSFLPVLRQASPWAALLAFVVRGYGIPVQNWRWIWVPLQYCASALVGVALLTLGAQLAKTKPGHGHWGRIGVAIGLRLLISPIIAWHLAPYFGFHGEDARIMTLSTAFPTAVNTALVAHEFKGDSEFASAVVFYSTLFSMFSVTALVAILRSAS